MKEEKKRDDKGRRAERVSARRRKRIPATDGGEGREADAGERRKRGRMKKMPEGKIYYSITEIAELTKVKPHVLRYWESEFPALTPRKNRAGNRVYQAKDIKLIFLIKHLLYEEGYTIAGAKKKLARKGAVDEKELPLWESRREDLLESLEKGLEDLLKTLDE